MSLPVDPSSFGVREQNVAPEPNAGLGQTQIQDGMPGQYPPYGYPPPPGSGAMQGWGISALVLSILIALTFLIACFGSLLIGSKSPEKALVIGSYSLVALVVALIFMSGGIGVLMRKEWGRRMIVVAASCALVLIVLDLVLSISGLATIEPSGTTASNPSLEIIQSLGQVWAYVADVLKAVYCALLLRFMVSDTARNLSTC